MAVDIQLMCAPMARNSVVLLLLPILAQMRLAEAQVALPQLRLPLPSVSLPLSADRLADPSEDSSPRRLEEARRLRIRELIRTQRQRIEADPRGEPIVRGEIVALSPAEVAIDKARTAGFTVLREQALDGLDARLVILAAPDGLTTRRALQRLRELDAAGVYDYNHLYTDGGKVSGDGEEVSCGDLSTAPDTTSAAAPTVVKVGLVDGGVAISHPVFRGTSVHLHGCSGVAPPSAHGTAVASLMIGRSAGFRGAAPGSELYAADVYCGEATGGSVEAVATALAWLARERVPVINVSLVGPANSMLETVIRLMIARGHLVIAAVGNDGPAAPPLYPAAYPDVIGVTAVDRNERVLLEACRGRQVKFAAPGADMVAADGASGFAAVRGTSFAAPIVAGLLAVSLREPDRTAAQRAVADLASHAIDLGAPGPDPVYGFGLVGGEVRPLPALPEN